MQNSLIFKAFLCFLIFSQFTCKRENSSDVLLKSQPPSDIPSSVWKGLHLPLKNPIDPRHAILDEIEDVYNSDRQLGYDLNATGHTRKIHFNNLNVYDPNTGRGGRRSHCVGMTYQLVLNGLKRHLKENPSPWQPTISELLAVRACWYIITPNCNGLQDAMIEAGIGQPVADIRSLLPGDLVQFWRVKTGHSVVFLSFLTPDESSELEFLTNPIQPIIGFKYFSSNGTTSGSEVLHAYFAGQCRKSDPRRDCEVNLSRLTAARLKSPSEFTQSQFRSSGLSLSKNNLTEETLGLTVEAYKAHMAKFTNVPSADQ